MLRGVIIDDGAPRSYSAWNLPPTVSFDHLTQLPNADLLGGLY